ncbi:RNA polymerase sigma factor SigM [Oxobacter pfennigii]|uniref:RNA polymerase sigma factor SigM n=1 Tax=Oxobacter pfennigii TaxID=36849 RepID=A0A0P8WW68_9CLOT|nr:RNA polymerase sigma factor SigM [Oxobacter pfennigii]
MRHASYLTGSTAAAEDIAQETFIRLYNHCETIENVGAWLSRVASNLAYNYIRNERARIKKLPEIDNKEHNVISLEDIVVRDYEIRTTRKILERLSSRDRMCLLLKFSGYKYNEISEITGIEKNSVGKILSRAQEKFKKIYLREVHD